MNKKAIPLIVVAVIVLGLLYWAFGVPSVGNPEISTDPAAIARGAYLYNAGGCGSCHTPNDTDVNGPPIGGHVLESPMGGAWNVPNITPDVETGIGSWEGRDFLLALKHGRSPSGGFYWPAFPYRSYSAMTDEDVLDLAAYLMAQPAVSNEVLPHDLPVWQISWMMAGWNIMADTLEGTPEPVVSADLQVQRGAYLARALGHCGECHTPRNALGMLQNEREFEGSDITSVELTPEALAAWTTEDFVGLLQLGMTASFDFVGGEMADVVEHTSRLSLEDQEAYAAFFLREQE